MAHGGQRLDEWLGRCAGLRGAGEAEGYLLATLRAIDLAAEDVATVALFARTCAKFGHHHASAALHADLLRRHAEVTDDPALLAQLNKFETVLAPAAGTSFRSAAGFLVAALQRLLASLAACGLADEEARLWLRGRLQPDPDAVLDALARRLQGTQPTVISGRAVRFLEATRHARRAESTGGDTPVVLWGLALLIASGLAFAYASPLMMWLFNWDDAQPVLVTPRFFAIAGVLWPGMLLLTWCYARRRSAARRSSAFIAPAAVPAKHPCLFGEIMPFGSDQFYHIFQFIWLFFAYIALYAFIKLNHLPKTAQHLLGSGDLAGALAAARPLVWQDLTPSNGWSDVLYNDGFAILLAVIGALGAVAWQWHIQTRRSETGRDIYWWDWRLDPQVWWVRLAMIFLDVVMVVYLLVKLGVLSLLLHDLLQTPDLRISLFGPVDLGGQAPVFALYMAVMTILLLFGFFLMASLYLHRNVSQYWWLDRISLAAYLLLGAALLLWPVGQIYANLDDRKSAEIERVLPQLEAARNDPAQVGLANQYLSYIKSVEAVPSALLSLDLLLSPVALLLAQTLILLWQVTVRGRPAPLMEKLLG